MIKAVRGMGNRGMGTRVKKYCCHLLGGFLGILRRFTAYSPRVRQIVASYRIDHQGAADGGISAVLETKVRALALGTVFGLVVGAFFAYLILLMNPGHTLNIMLPGSLVGIIVGYAAQKHQAEAPVLRGSASAASRF